jgi:phosphoglycerate kinase
MTRMYTKDVLKMSDLDLSDKKILMRVDFNVPLADGKVTNDARIRASLPAIKQALEAGASVLIVSHLGRPKAGEYDEQFSLAPVAKHLSDLLGTQVPLARDWINGVDVEPGQVVMCENVRFLQGELDNDDDLARRMATLCNLYVNDAFGTAHRAQASTSGVAKYVPVACAGPLMMAELKALSKALDKPDRPLLAIVGGAKVSTKLTLLDQLLDQVDELIVGGGIVNTFMAAAGLPIGNSLHEPDLVPAARDLLTKAEASGKTIPLPTDVVCAKEFKPDAVATTRWVDDIEADDLIMDVGPETAENLAQMAEKAGTIIWNGPLGVFEYEQFSAGTRRLAEAIASSKAFSIAGGGDTVAAIAKYGLADKISYISTGGGAFLAFLQGETLPAIAMLEESARAWAAMERAREY